MQYQVRIGRERIAAFMSLADAIGFARRINGNSAIYERAYTPKGKPTYRRYMLVAGDGQAVTRFVRCRSVHRLGN